MDKLVKSKSDSITEVKHENVFSTGTDEDDTDDSKKLIDFVLDESIAETAKHQTIKKTATNEHELNKNTDLKKMGPKKKYYKKKYSNYTKRNSKEAKNEEKVEHQIEIEDVETNTNYNVNTPTNTPGSFKSNSAKTFKSFPNNKKKYFNKNNNHNKNNCYQYNQNFIDGYMYPHDTIPIVVHTGFPATMPKFNKINNNFVNSNLLPIKPKFIPVSYQTPLSIRSNYSYKNNSVFRHQKNGNNNNNFNIIHNNNNGNKHKQKYFKPRSYLSPVNEFDHYYGQNPFSNFYNNRKQNNAEDNLGNKNPQSFKDAEFLNNQENVYIEDDKTKIVDTTN